MKYPVLYIFNFKSEYLELALKRFKCSIDSIINQVDNIYILNASNFDIKKHLQNSNKITIINKPLLSYHNKSLLINFAVKNFLCNYEYYIASDIDLIYPLDYYQKLTNYIYIENIPIRVLPKNQVMKFEYYSSNYKELLNISKQYIQHATGESRGNGLIHIPSFIKIHGYDERYLGYAPEDLDFNDRISQINKYIFDSSIIHIHLWHEIINQNNLIENNKIYAESKEKTLKHDIVRNQNIWGDY